MGPEFQKCNITTFVTTEGHRQQRRKERHEEESEGVEKGNEKENRKASEQWSWRRLVSWYQYLSHAAVSAIYIHSVLSLGR